MVDSIQVGEGISVLWQLCTLLLMNELESAFNLQLLQGGNFDLWTRQALTRLSQLLVPPLTEKHK